MIYTVTLMDRFKDEKNAQFNSPVSSKGICWIPDSSYVAGYFTKLEDAVISIENNSLDVWEHCYEYAVIEAFDEGFYPMPEMKQMWFRHDSETDRFYQIEPPVYNLVYKYAF